MCARQAVGCGRVNPIVVAGDLRNPGGAERSFFITYNG